MNPPPPTEEAVKAAFAYVDMMARGPFVRNKAIRLRKQMDNFHESGIGCDFLLAATIVSAHARALQEELDDVEKLIKESNLHRVQCGGMSVGHYTQPTVTRLRPINEAIVQRTRTKELQEQAHRARQLAAWRGIAERLGDALVRVCNCITPPRSMTTEALQFGREALSELAKLKGEQQ